MFIPFRFQSTEGGKRKEVGKGLIGIVGELDKPNELGTKANQAIQIGFSLWKKLSRKRSDSLAQFGGSAKRLQM